MAMSENEAIIRCEKLINGLSVCCATSDAFKDENKGYTTFETMRKFAESCKNALEEIQSYRAIGTVEELQAYKNGSCTNNCSHYDNVVEYIRNKAIDDFAEAMKAMCHGIAIAEKHIDNVAEQLKGEKNNE